MHSEDEQKVHRAPRGALATKEKNTVTSYLNSLRRFDQLTHAEVVSLFQRYEEGRTEVADDQYILTGEAQKIRDRLIECNLRLVVSIAKQYKSHNIPIEDLIQEGNLGLMKSIDRFDWKMGFRFSTYASWWIKQAIGQHVLKRKKIVRLPAHAANAQRKMIQATADFRKKNGAEPTAEELTELIGVSKTVVNATMHAGRGVVSLQTSISPGYPNSGGDGNTYENKIADERPGVDPFENVAEHQLLAITKRVLKTLSPKEAAILRLRFGLVEDATDDRSYPITEAEMQAVMSGKGLT